MIGLIEGLGISDVTVFRLQASITTAFLVVSLFPKLFTSYLNHALETLEHRRSIVTGEHDYTSGAESEHDYAILGPIPWPTYLGYANDLDFIGRPRKESQATVLLAEEIFAT